MPTEAPTSSAPSQERVEHLFLQSERLGLKKAVESGARVGDVSTHQKSAMQEILAGAKGGDGASIELSFNGQSGPQPDRALAEATEKKIDEVDGVRKKEAGEDLDGKVGNFEGTPIAGVQNDDTRERMYRDDLLTEQGMKKNPLQLRKVVMHELQHTKQETGDATFSLPPTGDPAIDQHRKNIRRLAFRERDSMAAEGGVGPYTSRKYKEQYWDVVEAVRKDLERRGLDGEKLVTDAARTTEGFKTLFHTYAEELLGNPKLNP